jgi:hypothetical protein
MAKPYRAAKKSSSFASLRFTYVLRRVRSPPSILMAVMQRFSQKEKGTGM